MPHTDIISSLVPTADIFVGGEWKRGRGALYASVYPADGSVNTEITTADAAETRVLVASAANTFRYFAACLETLDEEVTPSRGDYLTMSMHEPIGVIAAITPWNSPIASDAQKLAPALAGGNAVVLKPAEVTPLVSLALARI